MHTRAPVRRAGMALLLVLGAGCSSTRGTASTSSPSASSTVVTPTAPTASPDTGPTGTIVETAAQVATRALFVDVAGGDPGCSAAVARGGAVVFAEAYGSARLDPPTPMSPSTVVDIGSVSKQFTATAIALLSERGEVDLDAPLAEYVAGLPAWANDVTIREMLHHTSGIPDYVDLLVADGIAYSDPSDEADALRVLAAAEELDFEPGTSWEYSNSNYFLLGEVVLGVTGDDLGVFLGDEVFGPLGLDAVMDPVADIAGKATSYEWDGEAWQVADSPWTQTGDGGVQTTPTELVRWAAQYWDPTIGGDDIDALRLDDAVETDTDGERYGFGIIESTLDGVRVLEHTGSWAGFTSSFVVAPDQQLAVAVTCTSAETVPAAESDTDTDTDIADEVLRLWLP